MRSTPRLLACWLLLTWLLADSATAAPAAPSQGQELVGTPMRSWAELRWLGPPPGELRGKVVLVRWWSDACPMCSGALPSLGRLYEEHQKEGLVVVGVYHPKPAAPITPEMTQMVRFSVSPCLKISRPESISRMKTLRARAAWFSFFMPSSGANCRSSAASTGRPWLML